MNPIRLLTLIMAATFIISGCSQDPKAKIKSLEEKMSSEKFTFDEEGIRLARELTGKYIEFADTHKDDAESPAFLHHAAELSLNLNEHRQSLELYNRVIYQYPGYYKTPECLFMVGFIYENYLLNLGKAKEIYETFIARYPEHDLADDAAACIKNLGKSPEELLREFEQINAGTGGPSDV
jgi:tetratricopeptide (TPR) repeat protein